MVVARSRSSSYPVEYAVADVVQLCLDDGAGQVDIGVEFAGARTWIRIAADVDLGAVDVVSACMTQATAVSISADGAVHLEGLHDVLAYRRQEGRVIETVVAHMRSRIAEALGLAFHRVLRDGRLLPDGRLLRAALTITVNAEPVAARDPVAAEAEITRPLPRQL